MIEESLLFSQAANTYISDKIVPTNIEDPLQAPLVKCINPLHIGLVDCPALWDVEHNWLYVDVVQLEFGPSRNMCSG